MKQFCRCGHPRYEHDLRRGPSRPCTHFLCPCQNFYDGAGDVSGQPSEYCCQDEISDIDDGGVDEMQAEMDCIYDYADQKLTGMQEEEEE